MADTSRSLDPEELLACRAWMRGMARRLVDDRDADDVVQDAYLTALRHNGPVRSLRPWLARVVRSRAIDLGVAAGRRARREDAARVAPRVPATEELVARADIQRFVAQAVTELPEPYRTTVLLRWFEDLAPAEIARRCGLPHDTVKTRLRRAHALLRERLDAEFGPERERWKALLLPFLTGAAPRPAPSPRTPAAVSTTAALTAGGIAVGTKVKMALVAAVIVLVIAMVGGAAWVTWPAAVDSETPASSDVAPAASSSGRRPETAAALPHRAVSGIVRRRIDGVPVGGARVTVTTAAGTIATTTASDGAFVLDDVPGARGALAVDAGEQLRADDVDVTAETSDVGVVWLTTVARLRVHVVDASGAPVPAAAVSVARWRSHGSSAHVDSSLLDSVGVRPRWAEERGGETDAAGDAVLTGLQPGTWLVVAAAPGRTSMPAYVTLDAGQSERSIEVRMGAAHALRGTVLSFERRPVAGCVVWIDTGRTTLAADTDAAGRFELEGLPAADLVVRVGPAAGVGTDVLRVRVPDVQDVTLVLPATGRIEGTVRDALGGAVPDVMVAVELHGLTGTSLRTTSATDGTFAFEGVPEGALQRVCAIAPDRVQRSPWLDGGHLVEEGPDGSNLRDAVLLRGETLRLDVVMVPGGIVAGHVVGPDGPVAGAQVWRWRLPPRGGADWESTVTGADGAYELPPQLPGPVVLEVRAPGLFVPGLPEDVSRALRRDEVPDRFLVQVPESGRVTADLQVVAGPPVSGRVVDAAGVPAEGVPVGVEPAYSDPPQPAVVTAAGGTFRVDRVPPGRRRILRASSRDGALVGRSPALEVVAGRPIDGVEIVLTEPRQRSDPPSVTVTGRVVDRVTGRAVAGAAVACLESSPLVIRGARRRLGPWQEAVAATTGDDGGFTAHVSGRTVAIALWADGYAEETVPLQGAPTSELRIAMERSAAIGGRVLSGDGTPLAHRAVVAQPAGQSISAMRDSGQSGLSFSDRTKAITGADGTFTLRDLRPGSYSLLAYTATDTEGRAIAFGPFEAGCGDLVLRLDAPATGTLSLRVQWPDGRPASGAMIQYVAQGKLGGLRIARVIEDGRAEVGDLPEPAYDLLVTADAGGGDYVRAVFRGLAPRDAEHVLVLRHGPAIAGRVVDEHGDALAGAEVEARPAGDVTSRLLVRSARTAADGRFELPDLEECGYDLYAIQDGDGRGRRLVRSVRTTPGSGQVDLVATLEERISGTVVDEAGAPVAGMRIGGLPTHVGPARVFFSRTATTDERGRFELTGVAPGAALRLEVDIDRPIEERRRIVAGARPAAAGESGIELRVAPPQSR